MKVTLDKTVDVAEFEITAQHNPNYLQVKVDGAVVPFDYAAAGGNLSHSTVTLRNLSEGQTVEITEEKPHTIEGEKPILVNTYPTITRIKFKINSLDSLPKPTGSED